MKAQGGRGEGGLVAVCLCTPEPLACLLVFSNLLLAFSPSALLSYAPFSWDFSVHSLFASVIFLFTRIWLLYPPMPSSFPPPSCSLSLALFPCFSLSLSDSLSPWEREISINGWATVTAHATGCRQHLLLRHLSSALWLLSLPEEVYREERKSTGVQQSRWTSVVSLTLIERSKEGKSKRSREKVFGFLLNNLFEVTEKA